MPSTSTPSPPSVGPWASPWLKRSWKVQPPAWSTSAFSWIRTPWRPDCPQISSRTSTHHWTCGWAAQSTKQELLSLIGTLSFAAKVVPAGRTFLRRMIDLSTTVDTLQAAVPFSEPFQLDLQWWRAFVTPWNGRSFFFLPNWTLSADLDLYTDSSGTIGYGAYCQGHWFNGRWTPAQLSHSIQWKELYPIVLAAYIWGEHWSTLRIRLLCDNQAVVHCIVTGTSRCPHLMSLLRNIFILAARHNFNISAQHIPGIHNNIADSLSRFLMQDFRNQAPLASPTHAPSLSRCH